jgi:hypothetical protein
MMQLSASKKNLLAEKNIVGVVNQGVKEVEVKKIRHPQVRTFSYSLKFTMA